MKKGNVYKAKYQMKWAGLILLALPWGTYLFLKHLNIDPYSFWFVFFVIGIIWTLAFYSFVVTQIWKKIKARYILVLMTKVLHYHRLCIKYLNEKNYDEVYFILHKCLAVYDSNSTMTYFIRGALMVGQNDEKSLSDLYSTMKQINL